MVDRIDVKEVWEVFDETGQIQPGTHTNQSNALERLYNERKNGNVGWSVRARVTMDLDEEECPECPDCPEPGPLPVASIQAAIQVNEGETANFVVSLDEVSDENVQIEYFYVLGSASEQDLVAHNGILVIPAGATENTIQIEIADDDIVEENETFTVELTNPVNCTIGNDKSVCTIIDNDVAPDPDPEPDPDPVPTPTDGEWTLSLVPITQPPNGQDWVRPAWASSDYLPNLADTKARIAELPSLINAETDEAAKTLLQSELNTLNRSLPRPKKFDEKLLVYPVTPPASNVVKWDNDHFELIGGFGISTGSLESVAKWLTTSLGGISVKGSPDAVRLLAALHINASASTIEVEIPITPGKDLASWKKWSVVDVASGDRDIEPINIYKFRRFRKDYTQTRAAWFNDRYILWGTRQAYSSGATGAEWRTGVHPWIGIYDTVTGESVELPMEGFNPQHFGGGFTQVPQDFADAHLGGRNLLLNRGGYLSGQGSANGPCSMAVKFQPDALLDPLVLQRFKWGNGGSTFDNTHIRTPDIMQELWSANPADTDGDDFTDKASWAVDTVLNGASWVNYGGKHGLLHPQNTSVGEGYWYYKSAVKNSSRRSRILITDPMHFAESAAGTRGLSEVEGIWYGKDAVDGCEQFQKFTGSDYHDGHLYMSYDLGWANNKHKGAGIAVFRSK